MGYMTKKYNLGDKFFKGTVADMTELLATTGQADGEFVVVTSPESIWIWNATTQTWMDQNYSFGWFETVAELSLAHPVGNVGDFAIIGDTKTIWIWDNDANDWLETKGAKGDQGDPGIQGPTGADGLPGTQGAQGVQGIQGIQGSQGTPGEKGEKGDTGAQGLKGDTGDKGDKGDSGVQGIQGLQGVQGIPGEKGDKGDQGVQGTGINIKGTVALIADLALIVNPTIGDGYIVTEDGNLYLWDGALWNNAGVIVGPQGIPGTPGEKGDKGDQGIQGTQGIQGIPGDKGDKGDIGLPGTTTHSGLTDVLGNGSYHLSLTERDRILIHTNNRVIVGTTGHFTTIKDAVAWFNTSATGNAEILIDDANAEINTDSITIESTHNLIIRGLGINVTTISIGAGMTGKPAFIVKSNCDFNRFTANVNLLNYGTLTNEDFIKFNAPNLYCEITDVVIDSFKIGIYDASGIGFFLFNSIISNCGRGVVIDHANPTATSTDIEIVTIEQCPVGIDLVRSASDDLILSNIIFNNPTAGIGVRYAGTTYIVGNITNIFSCTWNQIGTFLSGFDFTLSRDANFEIIGCIGTEDKKPHAHINVTNNTSVTSTALTTVYYKAVFTNTKFYTCKLGIGNNRMTNLTSHKTDIKIWVSGNVQVNSNNRTVRVGLAKNGDNTPANIIDPFPVRCVTSGLPYPFHFCCYLEDIFQNDYLELFLNCSQSGSQVTMTDVSWFYEAK